MKALILILALLLLAACDQGYVAPSVRFEDVGSEDLNNQYESKIVEKQAEVENEEVAMYDIEYEYGGETFRNYYRPELEPALDWIKNNTPENSKFLNWWDYGHMIRGYAERDVIVYSPSEALLWTLASGEWDESAGGAFAGNEVTSDVLEALTTANITVTAQLMEKYNATYIFITVNDFEVLKYVSGKELNGAVVIYMIAGEELEGFELVYNDSVVRIYQKY